MNELIKAINQGGYLYIQIHNGDIYLYDSSKKIDVIDFDTMTHYEFEMYKLTLEFIYDREEYEKGSISSTFQKSIRLKDIRAIRQFNSVRI